MRLIAMLAAIVFAFATPALAGTSPVNVPGATTVSVDQAVEMFDNGVVFIDVRKMSDFEAGRVPGAVHLDSKSAFTEAALETEVAKDDPVVIYCNGHACMRSSKASAMAVEWGWTNVHYLRDGFPAWDAAGHPVE